MNIILVLRKDERCFSVINDVPDKIIEDGEKVEEYLGKYFDMNHTEWVSVVDIPYFYMNEYIELREYGEE